MPNLGVLLGVLASAKFFGVRKIQHFLHTHRFNLLYFRQ